MTENVHPAPDAIDRRILREVQADIGRPVPAIADAVGISVSAYRRRLTRLRKAGVVLREVALVDSAQLGIEIIVAITMMEEQSSGYDRLKRRIRSAPEVTQCYSVTGDVDLIAHVTMPDMATYEQWIQDFILSDPAVRRCNSHVVYSRVKFTTAVPV
ncbi:Lrp/AsnC family transcriptional regulator [Aurantiacibacter sp. MUD61]|uniref:Lrp/AsnC family transcriptional regulator n=1 Tax=Aurantiacibacter sp. MUD61 TaxID=3009083 RepID=UPI0022F0C526|nr:Lrp/AsnC family transcriptional regulator [Aurantiacibacter sp. MUD61]